MAARYEELRRRYFRLPDGRFAVPPAHEVVVEWSSRLTAAAGVCYPSRKVIRLSTHYHAAHPGDVDSTLLHEMIHLIVPHHGPAFRQWMAFIQAQGGRVDRYARERATPRGAPRWLYRCQKCGAAIQRYRRLPYGGRHHRHKGCNGRLEESPAS